MSEARRRVLTPWRFLITTLAGLVILASAQVTAVAAPASAYRNFDAVTTANENNEPFSGGVSFVGL
ncbi:hypothetical protein GCM10022254_68610 [Actinomadura meridiana]|uniref:Uncharacterized protein n=1 Tax=Actinomadura meridiana TaxID=559626 RepID=A0ABP8CMS0_9ACTN